DQLTLLSDLSTMRAGYVIETASWQLMARQSTFGNANDLFAIGISATRLQHADVAEKARAALADRARDEREGDLLPAIRIMERELAASIAFAAGRRDEALAILRAAADDESRLPAPLGLPEPIKPAPELLGEMLVEAGQAADADPFFEAALRRNPKRSLSLAGRARAATARGERERARALYGELLANFENADADMALAAEARNAVAQRDTPRKAPRWVGLFTSTGGLLMIAIAGAVLLAAVVMLRASAKGVPPVQEK